MKVKYFIEINLVRPKNDEHTNLNKQIADCLEEEQTVKEKYPVQAAAYLSAVVREDNTKHGNHSSEYTVPIQDADTERVITYKRLRGSVRELTKSPVKAMADAAEFIYSVFKNHGDVSTMKTSERTGALINLCLDLNVKYRSFIETLALTQLAQLLETENQEYIRLSELRLHEWSEQQNEEMAIARSLTDEALENLLIMVASGIISIGMAPFKHFVEFVNEAFKRAKINMGTSSTTKPEGGDGSSGEQQPKPVKLKFRKLNGQEIELTGVEGEEYEIPETEEGYVWVSAEGEIQAPNGVFPAKDTTYVEVALGDRVKDVFHYLNGEHETFYGNAGTEYQVPATSSDQTIWMPTPTGIFSTVSAQFFETLRPAGGQGEGEQEEGGDQGQGGGEQEGKKKAEWFGPTGELLHTQYYEVGEHIVPPEPPAGYIWNYHPNYMPDYDLEIDCLEDE